MADLVRALLGRRVPSREADLARLEASRRRNEARVRRLELEASVMTRRDVPRDQAPP